MKRAAATLGIALCAIVGPGLPASGASGTALAAAGGAAESAMREELLAFTAISLKEALGEVVSAFADRHPDVTVRLHAGASGLLARQIERGAPADLFLSAAPLEIDRLQDSGLLRPGSRVPFAGNRMVIVVARGTTPPAAFRDLADPSFDRVAIGNPRTVPAGRYAIEALRAEGIDVTLAERLVPAENARQVLEYVVRGETAAGLVYLTDARLAGADVVLGPEAPAGSHTPILYEAAVPRDAVAQEAAALFLGFLTSGKGQAVLARFGFLPPKAP